MCLYKHRKIAIALSRVMVDYLAIRSNRCGKVYARKN